MRYPTKASASMACNRKFPLKWAVLGQKQLPASIFRDMETATDFSHFRAFPEKRYPTGPSATLACNKKFPGEIGCFMPKTAPRINILGYRGSNRLFTFSCVFGETLSDRGIRYASLQWDISR
jgi:hypothetical protein